MSVIDIDLAMHHLLAEPDDQPLVQMQLDAAEEAAMQFLNRRFYADQAALDQARQGTDSTLQAAQAANNAAVAAAEAEADFAVRCRKLEYARQQLAEAYESVDVIAYGMVINDAIKAACLLKLGKLFADREDDAEMPAASKALLNPSRIRMGA